jgi:3',5'-nucleoside bisphosphate phosphatase
LIDLHVHTNCSDGSYTPETIVQRAAKRGLKAIAITDHDNVRGISRARKEAAQFEMEIIPGVEISVESAEGNLHMLGYFIDCEDTFLLDTLEFLRMGRQERIPKILQKLAKFDMPITLDEISNEAVGGVPGRPHVANVMYHKGYVRSRPEAFEKYLRKGAPAYEDKVKLGVEAAIKVIRGAGGLPVLAHPVSLEIQSDDGLYDRIKLLKELGLMGLEVYYSTHSKQQTKLYLEIAEDLDLCVTGGTDFHGTNKPDIELGRIPNGGPLPYSIVEEMKKRVAND